MSPEPRCDGADFIINARIFHSRDDGPECVIRADAQSILLPLPLHGTRDKLVVPVGVEG